MTTRKFASVLTIYGAPRAWEKPRDSHFLPNTVITMGVGSYFYCSNLKKKKFSPTVRRCCQKTQKVRDQEDESCSARSGVDRRGACGHVSPQPKVVKLPVVLGAFVLTVKRVLC